MTRATGTAAEFHGRQWPDADNPARHVWLFCPSRPAIVLGSTQAAGLVDSRLADDSGVDVVRRRSGGGAVLLVPGDVAWVDLFVPAEDRLWQPDVGRAFHWLGDAWVAALASLGIEGVAHKGKLVRGPWSRLVCFAGLGPGEVTVGGRKVVGISQRRTREGALFQCAALVKWDATALLRLFDLAESQRQQGAQELGAIAAGLNVETSAIEDAFLAAIGAA